MTTTKILDQLLRSHTNRYELVLKVAQKAKQIKAETRDQPRATNPVIQALQMVAAEGDGSMLIAVSAPGSFRVY